MSTEYFFVLLLIETLLMLHLQSLMRANAVFRQLHVSVVVGEDTVESFGWVVRHVS